MTNIIQTAYKLYRKDILSGRIFSLVTILLQTLVFFPIVGAIIFSYFFPKVLTWYYQKLSGEKLNPNYHVSFISLLVPSMIASIGGIFLFLGIFSVIGLLSHSSSYSIYNLSAFHASSGFFSVFMVFEIIALIVYILSLYSFYGSLFGKVNKYKLDFSNSIKIFAYVLLIGIVVYGIYYILILVFSPMAGFVGEIIGTIFMIIIGIQLYYLVPMLVAKNL
ncbi:hypothetical protein YN1_4980 [Nanoarchaeota archaeon]